MQVTGTLYKPQSNDTVDSKTEIKIVINGDTKNPQTTRCKKNGRFIFKIDPSQYKAKVVQVVISYVSSSHIFTQTENYSSERIPLTRETCELGEVRTLPLEKTSNVYDQIRSSVQPIITSSLVDLSKELGGNPSLKDISKVYENKFGKVPKIVAEVDHIWTFLTDGICPIIFEKFKKNDKDLYVARSNLGNYQISKDKQLADFILYFDSEKIDIKGNPGLIDFDIRFLSKDGNHEKYKSYNVEKLREKDSSCHTKDLKNFIRAIHNTILVKGEIIHLEKHNLGVLFSEAAQHFLVDEKGHEHALYKLFKRQFSNVRNITNGADSSVITSKSGIFAETGLDMNGVVEALDDLLASRDIFSNCVRQPINKQHKYPRLKNLFIERIAKPYITKLFNLHKEEILKDSKALHLFFDYLHEKCPGYRSYENKEVRELQELYDRSEVVSDPKLPKRTPSKSNPDGVQAFRHICTDPNNISKSDWNLMIAAFIHWWTTCTFDHSWIHLNQIPGSDKDSGLPLRNQQTHVMHNNIPIIIADHAQGKKAGLPVDAFQHQMTLGHQFWNFTKQFWKQHALNNNADELLKELLKDLEKEFVDIYGYSVDNIMGSIDI